MVLYCTSIFVLTSLFFQNLHIRIAASLFFSISFFFSCPTFSCFFFCYVFLFFSLRPAIILYAYIMCTLSVIIINNKKYIYIYTPVYCTKYILPARTLDPCNFFNKQAKAIKLNLGTIWFGKPLSIKFYVTRAATF